MQFQLLMAIHAGGYALSRNIYRKFPNKCLLRRVVRLLDAAASGRPAAALQYRTKKQQELLFLRSRCDYNARSPAKK